jgi:hypothetical protein
MMKMPGERIQRPQKVIMIRLKKLIHWRMDFYRLCFKQVIARALKTAPMTAEASFM